MRTLAEENGGNPEAPDNPRFDKTRWTNQFKNLREARLQECPCFPYIQVCNVFPIRFSLVEIHLSHFTGVAIPPVMRHYLPEYLLG